jgi:hypothetical protein
MIRSSVPPAALAALLLLAGCAPSPAPAGSPGPAGSPDPAAPGASGPRQGWSITVTNILGEWEPDVVCGGDYVFVFGIRAGFGEVLTDLQGNETYGSEIFGADPREGTYSWSVNAGAGNYAPGDPVEGGGTLEIVPDANGHPPSEARGTGWNHITDEQLAWDYTEDDWITVRFERAPEPDWCAQFEREVAESADEYPDQVWEYYD